jgi:porin
MNTSNQLKGRGVHQDGSTPGIGYYYAAPSSELKDSVSPLIDLQNDQGVEAFYNFAVTPWFSVGADVQVIDPSLGDDTTVFAGLRAVFEL